MGLFRRIRMVAASRPEYFPDLDPHRGHWNEWWLGFFFVSFVTFCSRMGLQTSLEQKGTKATKQLIPFLIRQPNYRLLVPGKPWCFPHHPRPERGSSDPELSCDRACLVQLDFTRSTSRGDLALLCRPLGLCSGQTKAGEQPSDDSPQQRSGHHCHATIIIKARSDHAEEKAEEQ